MKREWLADEDNQHALYSVCKEMIIRYAPEEEPILEEIFPEYIILAKQGDISIGTTTEESFSFAGQAELLVLIILPAFTTLLGALLANYSSKRLAEIQGVRQEKLKEDVTELAKKHLPSAYIDEKSLKLLLETLQNTPQ
jgi:hypothetical protein